ncbi:MAG: carbohydrate porin [Polyangiaceae bacterium]|nr:carbohydrate porin [Polyangiaceae bacterium]
MRRLERQAPPALLSLAGCILLLTTRAQAQEPPAPGAPPAPAATALTPAPAPAAPAPGAHASPATEGRELQYYQPPAVAPSGKFEFGSYGRVMTSLDGRGGPGRDADLVAHGSRLDEDTYGELEFRREDRWTLRGADPVTTRVVATLAIGDPIFHSSGKFDARVALRNFYVEERDIGYKGLAVWAGSRMYRGDDAYLLNWWPLDNLNTMGGGVRLNLPSRTEIALHVGSNRLDNPYFTQNGVRPAPNNQFGTVTVPILNRPKVIESLRAEQLFMQNDKAGFKVVLYGELHQLSSGQREREPGRYEAMPGDSGYVAGLQLGAFTGERDTHVNLFLRYSTGIAAFGGDLAVPTSFAADRTTGDARELSLAFSGNYEVGPLAIMGAGYLRTFRGASPDAFSYANIDEGIVVFRPHYYFTERVGAFVEGSYQVHRRGVLVPSTGKQLQGSLARFGVSPFLSPAGRGSYTRPQLRLIWLLTRRDEGARSFYAADDLFARRQVEQFFGISAEWWFNSSYR